MDHSISSSSQQLTDPQPFFDFCACKLTMIKNRMKRFLKKLRRERKNQRDIHVWTSIGHDTIEYGFNWKEK